MVNEIKEMYHELSTHTEALEAFNKVLGSCGFVDEELAKFNVSSISLVIGLWLEKQDQILSRYLGDDMKRIEKIDFRKSLVKSREYTGKDASNIMNAGIRDMDAVIERKGILSTEAQRLKEECASYIQQYCTDDKVINSME